MKANPRQIKQRFPVLQTAKKIKRIFFKKCWEKSHEIHWNFEAIHGTGITFTCKQNNLGKQIAYLSTSQSNLNQNKTRENKVPSRFWLE